MQQKKKQKDIFIRS